MTSTTIEQRNEGQPTLSFIPDKNSLNVKIDSGGVSLVAPVEAATLDKLFAFHQKAKGEHPAQANSDETDMLDEDRLNMKRDSNKASLTASLDVDVIDKLTALHDEASSEEYVKVRKLILHTKRGEKRYFASETFISDLCSEYDDQRTLWIQHYPHYPNMESVSEPVDRRDIISISIHDIYDDQNQAMACEALS